MLYDGPGNSDELVRLLLAARRLWASWWLSIQTRIWNQRDKADSRVFRHELGKTRGTFVTYSQGFLKLAAGGTPNWYSHYGNWCEGSSNTWKQNDDRILGGMPDEIQGSLTPRSLPVVGWRDDLVAESFVALTEDLSLVPSICVSLLQV